MARKNTNKHYSLRKLKTGTASVAVALSVLGAGLVAGQTAKAESVEVSGQSIEVTQIEEGLTVVTDDSDILKEKLNKIEEERGLLQAKIEKKE
ncbi:YSIRK-type signal peptide-containing protein, partial [Streptococcus dysgalactiae]